MTFGPQTQWAGDKYVGEFMDGNRTGQGTYTAANGAKYVGEFRDNKQHGQGTYTAANGAKYVGEFRDNKQHGQGTLTAANGDKYVGEFRDDKQHGQGTITYGPSSLWAGDKYVGKWNDDMPHGRGTYFFTNGDQYVGEIRDGNIHGQGTYIFAHGDKYVGEFRDGMNNGYGTFSNVNGDQYVGEFKDGKKHGRGTKTFANGSVREGIWENDHFKYAQKVASIVIAKNSPKPSSDVKSEREKLQEKTAQLEKEKKQKPTPKEPVKKTNPQPSSKSVSSGSGFFVSKLGHIVTNEHVVQNCGSITVGDNAKKQVTVTLVETDKRNDLALLKISSTKMASAETKSLIRKLGVKIVPLASEGLLRSDDVELGESVLVAGYPYGEIFSDSIKVSGGMVSANRGMGDDIGQFQIDAAVQPGNSGGPIYDENGNIVGVVVAQLDRLKVAKAIGSLPENVNFGIKASTVRQFLTASGLPTKWSERSQSMSTTELAKIAKNQTVMVVCNQ